MLLNSLSTLLIFIGFLLRQPIGGKFRGPARCKILCYGVARPGGPVCSCYCVCWVGPVRWASVFRSFSEYGSPARGASAFLYVVEWGSPARWASAFRYCVESRSPVRRPSAFRYFVKWGKTGPVCQRAP